MNKAFPFLDALVQGGEDTVQSTDIGKSRTTQEEADQRPVVLVVDDNATLAEQLSDGLQTLGFRAIFRTSAEDALLLFSSGAKVGVLVLDINMPRTNGMMLIQELRHRYAACMPSIVIISGESGTDTVITALRLSVIDYLIKPVKPGELYTSVQRAFDRYLTAHTPVADADDRLLETRTAASAAPAPKPSSTQKPRDVLSFLVALKKLNDKWCQSNGLDYLEVQMLIELAWCRANATPVSVTGLIAGLGCALATGYRRLRKLEEAGYMTRYAEDHDRRFCYLEITDKSLKLLDEIRRQFIVKFPHLDVSQ